MNEITPLYRNIGALTVLALLVTVPAATAQPGPDPGDVVDEFRWCRQFVTRIVDKAVDPAVDYVKEVWKEAGEQAEAAKRSAYKTYETAKCEAAKAAGIVDNARPANPNPPSGPEAPGAGVGYDYCVTAYDSDDETVEIKFKWYHHGSDQAGETGWLGPYDTSDGERKVCKTLSFSGADSDVELYACARDKVGDHHNEDCREQSPSQYCNDHRGDCYRFSLFDTADDCEFGRDAPEADYPYTDSNAPVLEDPGQCSGFEIYGWVSDGDGSDLEDVYRFYHDSNDGYYRVSMDFRDNVCDWYKYKRPAVAVWAPKENAGPVASGHVECSADGDASLTFSGDTDGLSDPVGYWAVRVYLGNCCQPAPTTYHFDYVGAY